ncbi:hypothetical protein HY213_01960 [Candidatus Peregrinibacteria bacterium]|nr:hypothetical protein [Candidatus Peregrinibacteria bacterium]
MLCTIPEQNSPLPNITYNYGDGFHISHAIAQADALGIFGREGLFAASWQSLGYPETIDNPFYANSFITGAFDMYLDYDGKGSSVGDRSLTLDNPDGARLSLYAMKSTKDPTLLHIIAINKTTTETPIGIQLVGIGATAKTAAVYRLTASSLKPKAAGQITLLNDSSLVEDRTLYDRLPPLSVTTFEIRK